MKLRGRSTTWLALGLVALTSIFFSALAVNTDGAQPGQNGISRTPTPQDTPLTAVASVSTDDARHTHVPPSAQEQDRAAEASRAFKQALATLAIISIRAPVPIFELSVDIGKGNAKSVLSSFIPSLPGHGPVAKFIRFMLKLQQYTFRRLSLGAQERLGLGSKREDEARVKAVKVIDLLQHSMELGNMDALFLLAYITLMPPTQHFPADAASAYQYFQRHASVTGNGTSQAYLAFFHATGYRGIVPVDQAKAQLYYTFAANGGDQTARMALGYRYWSGIGTTESCENALLWYGSAAEQAMEKFLSGPPGGLTLPLTATQLSDLAGGVYGLGASVASTGVNAGRAAIRAGFARAAGETWADLLEYFQFNADRGEIDFAYRLGRIYYQGSLYPITGGIASGCEGVGAIPRNYKLARRYFLQIARQLWPHDPPSTMKVKGDLRHYNRAAVSAGYLGRMYLRGEGVKADPAIAKMWFERGIELGDRESYNGLGIIYRDKLIPGLKSDAKLYLAHFTAAAQQELAEAYINIGKYHFSRGEYALATSYFETAIRYGSPFEAYFYLGEIHAAQASTAGIPSAVASSSCAMAVSFYKLITERGVWDGDLLRDAETAWMTGNDQDKEVALLKWWITAERGSEIAQSNLAYILDQDKSILRLTRFSPMTPSNDTAKLALTQWTRAAAQRNIDALVKVGDYYYHGLGVPDESVASRLEKAAKYYQSAADTQLSALAMWNLGWMYENGVGVPQDFHLAKRNYDLAMETNADSYLPWILSLVKLHVRSIWHTLMGGKGGLSIWMSDEEGADIQTQTGERRELDVGTRSEGTRETSELEEEDDRVGDEDDGSWYIGKAREEFYRRRGETPAQGRREEEDPVQWARDRRNEEREQDSDFGPEDYFEGALRNVHYEEGEANEFAETLLLVFLCLVISVLLYIRTRIVERMRREQRDQQGRDENQEQRDRNRGVFPGPNDPARNDWAVLR